MRPLIITILLLNVTARGAELTIPTYLLPGGVWWASNSVGVVGGIPSVTTIYTNLSAIGTAADWTNIQQAILNCPSNQVVYLNEGAYSVPRSIGLGVAGSGGWLATPGHNGAVLRGAGIGRTTLNLTSGAGLNMNGFYESEDLTNKLYLWTSGYTQGTTNITISTNFAGNAATGITNGVMIILTQENDPNLITIYGSEPADFGRIFLNAWGKDCNQFQVVKVISVSNGTNLAIWPGVYMTNFQSGFRPQIYWNGNSYQSEKVGLEELTVNNIELNVNGPSLEVNYTYNCWVKNVEFISPGYAAVGINRSAHVTMHGCYAHDSASGGGSTSYGGYGSLSSDCLYENNIFNRITSPILLQAGASGNVVAYNFATNGIFSAETWMPTCFILHGAHPTMNLFEGNVGTSLAYDVIHGSSSHNIAFRNAVSGWQTNKIANTTPVIINASNRWESFIGNVFGKDNYHTNYEVTALTYPTNYGNVHTIYYLGFQGGNWTNYNSDTVTATSAWRQGNWDYATDSTIWDAGGAKTLPNSLYLSAQPSWWNASSAYPPIGSDLSPKAGTIPAEYRYLELLPAAIVTGGNIILNGYNKLQ